MSRKQRLHFSGAVYHVMHRGNDGQNIFFEDGDRRQFFLLCQESCQRYGCRIHAYCLMSNHLHLALQVEAIPLANVMQNISFRYTQFVNRKYKRTGHLFQGRYKSVLIDADRYLLELVRYIHLNPVRAGIVENPGEYPWSSDCHYGIIARPPWLTVDWVLAQFGENTTAALSRFKEFVAEGVTEGHRLEFHNGSFEGRALGNDTFINDALRRSEVSEQFAPSLEKVISAVCKIYGLSETQLAGPGKAQPAAEARAVAALFVRNTAKLSLTELGRRFNRHLSGLSQAARRQETLVNAEKPPVAKYRKLLEILSDCQD